MKLQILAIYDKASAMFMAPTFNASLGSGVRSFTDQVNTDNRENVMNQHPEDFSLHHIGVYDTDTGVITPSEKRCICSAETIYTGPVRTPTQYAPETIRENLHTGNGQGN